MDNTCSICLEEVPNGPERETLECGHVFHCRCMLTWVRRGTISCPTCRSDARLMVHLGPMPMEARAAWMIRISARKSAPEELKVLVARYRKLKAGHKEASDEVSSWEDREDLKIYRKLLKKRRGFARRLRDQRHLISLFSSNEFPCPALEVRRRGLFFD